MKNNDFILINFANPDMVGHTGNLEAAIVSVEASDLSLSRLLDVIEELGGAAIVTADHGNADQMYQTDKQGNVMRDARDRPIPHTSHTLNPVPLWIYAPSLAEAGVELEVIEHDIRRLSNVAATAFYLMGYKAPGHMDPPLVQKR